MSEAAESKDVEMKDATEKPEKKSSIGAKMRIKLKLPMSGKGKSDVSSVGEESKSTNEPEKKKKKMRMKLPLSKPAPPTDQSSAVENESESEGDNDGAIMQPVSLKEKEKEKSTPMKRKTHSIRPVKLPAIASPGLLMVPPSGFPKEKIQSRGVVTPETVFEHHMALAGYTTENRKKIPHRGSSVQRHVGDMFDSDVKLTLHFPPLVPDSWTENDQAKPKALLEGLQNVLESLPKSKKRPLYHDMFPVSVNISLPEEYVNKRKKFFEEVETREKAIIVAQEAEELLDLESEDATPKSAPTSNVPPIPRPPTPPKLSEIDGVQLPDYEDKFPCYPAKSTLLHLDKDAFHITEGRYFGLSSNFVTDPNFQGPLAPGIANINASQGAGLATAYTGVSSGGPGLTVSSFTRKKEDNENQKAPTTMSKKDQTKKESGPDRGAEPNATMDELKELLSKGGPEADAMRECIRKAAVVNSRSGKHIQSFTGPDAKIYPNASEAFALHAGIKPCVKCQSSKQGPYTCRLQQKHDEMDFDGGRSFDALKPLLEASLDSLATDEKQEENTAEGDSPMKE